MMVYRIYFSVIMNMITSSTREAYPDRLADIDKIGGNYLNCDCCWQLFVTDEANDIGALIQLNVINWSSYWTRF